MPIPVQVAGDPSTDFTPGRDDVVHAGVGAEAPARLLAELLRPATGFYLPVEPLASSERGISLTLNATTDPEIGDQGYRLTVGKAVTITANTTAGLFNGAQTLRQLFGPEIDSDTRQPGPWKVPGARIVDYPRFAHRGVMLDVARRFRPTADVKRFIDDIARYKINYLQLHLTDDQGWRIRIDKWPNLTEIGARSQVGGGTGGFYSKADYSDFVAYAAARGITIVPAIESPGHSNAALTSYPELNCDSHAPPPRTDTRAGYSSLCVGKDITYTFLDDVISEIAALTPGPYLQIGADEPDATTPSDYQTYVAKLPPIVAKHNKTPSVGTRSPGPPTCPTRPSSSTGAPSEAPILDTPTRPQRHAVLSPPRTTATRSCCLHQATPTSTRNTPRPPNEVRHGPVLMMSTPPTIGTLAPIYQTSMKNQSSVWRQCSGLKPSRRSMTLST